MRVAQRPGDLSQHLRQLRRGEPRFAHESVAHLDVIAPLRRQHLDGHRAVELHVAREVDHAHAAAPQLAVERIAAGNGELELEKQRIRTGSWAHASKALTQGLVAPAMTASLRGGERRTADRRLPARAAPKGEAPRA
ncbi:MAG: hypothetical protein ACYC7F_11015 [Gemmatimonadaceae bacterium]